MNRIIEPGGRRRAGIKTAHQDTPMATGATVQGQDTSGDVLVVQVGGLTKVEWIAAQVAGAIYSEWPTTNPVADIAEMAVDLAEAILRETQRRREAENETNGKTSGENGSAGPPTSPSP